MAHVPMDKAVLLKWLKYGYMEKQSFYATEQGTPQGGIISPVLANLALDGLEHLRSTANIRTSIRLQVDRYMGDEAEGRHDQPLSRRRWQFSPRREATPNRTKGLSGCMICKALSELRARLNIRALLFRQ